MTATAEHTETAKPAAPPVTRLPHTVLWGWSPGAALSQLSCKRLAAGLADLRGTLGYSFDGASWIPTVLNMSMMFTAVFGAFLGVAYGIRRVLLIGGALFTAA